MLHFKNNQIVGNYEIKRFYARGAYKDVYEAKNLYPSKNTFPENVLIAVPSTIDHHQKDRHKQIVKEFNIIKTLDHNNIVKVYELNQYGNSYYIVMEKVEGANLKDRIPFQPEQLDEAINIISQLAEAIDYAHSEDIIHRDIKPENILWNGTTVKLIDFGIGKIVDNALLSSSCSGTIFYMAPEQFTGKPTYQSDLWCLGVTFWQMLTNIDTFLIPNLMEAVKKNEHMEAMKNAGIHPRLQAVIAKMLSLDQSNRYASAKDFVSAIELAVRPKFIDVHSSDQFSCVKNLKALSKICQYSNTEPGIISYQAIFKESLCDKFLTPHYQYLMPTLTNVNNFDAHADSFYIGMSLMEIFLNREFKVLADLEFSQKGEVIFNHPNDLFPKPFVNNLTDCVNQYITDAFSNDHLTLDQYPNAIIELIWHLFGFTQMERYWISPPICFTPVIPFQPSYFSTFMKTWWQKNHENEDGKTIHQLQAIESFTAELQSFLAIDAPDKLVVTDFEDHWDHKEYNNFTYIISNNGKNFCKHAPHQATEWQDRGILQNKDKCLDNSAFKLMIKI